MHACSAFIKFSFTSLSRLFVEDNSDHFDLHPGFSHMEDEKGNKLHLFKKYF